MCLVLHTVRVRSRRCLNHGNESVRFLVNRESDVATEVSTSKSRLAQEWVNVGAIDDVCECETEGTRKAGDMYGACSGTGMVRSAKAAAAALP